MIFFFHVHFSVSLVFVWRVSADDELCEAAALVCLQIKCLLLLTGSLC